MKPGLQLRLNQQLSLTPQLQQAIRLLQLSQLELETELRELVESNPLLEFSDDVQPDADADTSTNALAEAEPAGPEPTVVDNNWGDLDVPARDDFDMSQTGSRNAGSETFEPQNAATEDLRDHLSWQLNLSPFTPREHAIAMALIDAMDDDGYLHDGLEPVIAALQPQLQLDDDEIDIVRRRLQRFDPAGVASLDLRDCLLAQLDQLEADPAQTALARRIVAEDIELLARNDLARLARRMHVDVESVAAAAALIRTLDPRPGLALDPTPVEYIAPDAYVRRIHDQWHVSLSPDCTPRLELNQHYCGLISQARRDDASYLRGQLQEARWLLKSLESRADTLLRVANVIVRRQSAFLDYGPEAMRPMVLREVAEEVDMHESTISRVTTRKYLHTPRGIFEFKYFFSSGVSTEDGGSASATAIQAMLRKLVNDEDVRKPLSDQALANHLNQRGIQVARRTVAKYREALRIPSSSERQRRV